MATSIQQYISHFDGLDGLEKLETQIQSPASGEVLVEIHSVSLNYRDMEGIDSNNLYCAIWTSE